MTSVTRSLGAAPTKKVASVLAVQVLDEGVNARAKTRVLALIAKGPE